MKLTFWQSMVSFHMSALVRALAESGHEVLLVVSEELPEERRALGWYVPNISPARVVLAPRPDEVENLVAEGDGRTIHIIGGRGSAATRTGLRACRRSGAKVVLLRESADPRGGLGLLRRIRYRSERVVLGRSVAGVLAMGRRGVSWYRACGWPPEVVLPFAYFTEAPVEAGGLDPLPRGKGFRLAFVGKLVHGKGLDLLLRALRDLRELEWQLAVIGDGPERASYLSQAERGGIGAKVDFLGVLPNREAANALAASDLLVFPTRHDGWSVVVNEALVRGVPVICSDCCGAADLVGKSWRGQVFRGEDMTALRGALGKWIGGGRRTSAQSERISTWAIVSQGGPAPAKWSGR